MTDSGVNVLFIWDVGERLRQYLADGLAATPSVRLVFPPDLAEETLLGLAPEADVIVGWRPSRGLLDAATRAQLVINPGVGVQHLVEMFRELNAARTVLLANGHGNTAFTAQHAVALLLALTNRVVPHHNWMRAGEWRKGDSDARSVPLRGRHVGLLGYGAINRRVHRMLSGFDVRFSILRRAWPNSDQGWAGRRPSDETPDVVAGALYEQPDVSALIEGAGRFTPSELDAFLDTVDTLIVAVPLTDETEGMIGAPELARLGSDGLLVHVGRGSVVDEAALYDALANATIGGAALDVWYEYRPEADTSGLKYPYGIDHPFHDLDNVVLSPHRAASPFDDLARWDEVIENIRRVSEGRQDLLNIVDLERGY